MKERIRQHTISIKHASDGIIWALSTQPNFTIHLLLSFLAVLCALFFQISRIEWLILILTIGLGLTIEMANTALEAVCDAITKEWRREVKIAKDVAAGMMLTFSFFALLVALCIFGPRILSYL